MHRLLGSGKAVEAAHDDDDDDDDVSMPSAVSEEDGMPPNALATRPGAAPHPDPDPDNNDDDKLPALVSDSDADEPPSMESSSD